MSISIPLGLTLSSACVSGILTTESRNERGKEGNFFFNWEARQANDPISRHGRRGAKGRLKVEVGRDYDPKVIGKKGW